jgi:hypothetical protein
MSGIESEVLESFFLQLESSEAVSGSVVEALRTLLAADRLPKPEHLVALYVASSGDSLT